MSLFLKIWHKITKMRLRPIRVFCFHQVSEVYDSNLYCQPDWVPMKYLKKYLIDLQEQGYNFISLEAAHAHIKKDIFRLKKYAVLTADDGLQCQAELLPWLEERHIPITLFIDLETLDGKTCTTPVKDFLRIVDKKEEKKHAELLYLTSKQLEKLVTSILSIGMHGIKHEKVNNMSEEEFAVYVSTCEQELSTHPAFIPFFAYPYGAYSRITDDVLYAKRIVPVIADGCVNYNDSNVIHREILEHIYQCQSHQL